MRLVTFLALAATMAGCERSRDTETAIQRLPSADDASYTTSLDVSGDSASLDMALFSDSIMRIMFSYPDDAGVSLPEWVEHWITQTLERDGYAAGGAIARVTLEADSLYHLVLTGPAALDDAFEMYQGVIGLFLRNGELPGLFQVPQLREDGVIEPGWSFFLPLGLPMLNQRSVQFFHFPPSRLLMPNRDYLGDPVPYRWEQLLIANGVDPDSVQLYETVLDGAPIAAPDDVGAFIPIDSFSTYQEEQLRTLLWRDVDDSTSVPVVVYGVPAMARFEHQFRVNLDVLVPQVARIAKPFADSAGSRRTHVLGANHPYHFYATAQDSFPPGDGRLGPGCRLAQTLMMQDVIAACWQVAMADDSGADPYAVLQSCADLWFGAEKEPEMCALVQHQGSLIVTEDHPDQTCPGGQDFCFAVSMDQARAVCDTLGYDACARVSPR